MTNGSAASTTVTLGWECVATDLAFPEGLRWHDDALWCSDIFGRAVLRIATAVDTVATFTDLPSGLGWRPDGTLLVVAMRTRRLLAVAHGEVTVVASSGLG